MFAASSGGSEAGRGPKSKGPAWQGSGSTKGTRKAAAQWKPSEQKQADPEARWRAIRALVTLAAAVLLAVFIYFVLTRPEPTPLLILRPAAYPLQMPPVALAEEDAELLGRISPQNVRAVPLALETGPAALDGFRAAIKSAASGFNSLRRGPNIVLVHMAAHGMLDQHGRACIIPPSGNPFDTSTWLQLTDLFQAIADEPGLKNRDKLVLLDCQRVASSWRSGWLENRFFEGLGKLVKDQNDPRLTVLCAADSGELSWAAPELRGSTFGHFLARGLRGEAAPAHRALTLGELFRFVALEVDSYSRRRRGARQQPVLFHLDQQYKLGGDGNDKPLPADVAGTTLCYIDRRQARRKLAELQSDFDPLSELKKTFDGRAARQAAADAVSPSRSLTEVWELYRQRREPEGPRLPGYVVDPVAWGSIQQRLAAIGQRLLAGKQYQGSALQTEIDRLAKDLADDAAWQADGELPLLDIPQRLRFGAAPREQPTMGNLLAAYLQAEPAKREEAIPKQVSRVRLIQDIYAELTRAGANDARSSLALAAELLQRAPRTDQRLATIEEHFVTLLDRGLPASRALPGETLIAALSGRQQAEDAANPIDLRAHYAVERLVNAADEERRRAEDALYLGSDDGSSRRADYQPAIERGQRAASWLRLRDEIWAELPLLAEWNAVRAAASGDAADERRLVTAVQKAIELDDALEQMIEARDEPQADETAFRRCGEVETELEPLWQAIRADLASIYERPTNVQQAYRRPDDLRNAEIAICWPPMGGNFSQFLERYLQTLDDAELAALSERPSDESHSASKPPAGNMVLRELHRLLDYEFVDPYAQHRYSTAWDESAMADEVFRTAGGGRESAWSRLNNLLNRYNEAIAKESPAWSESQRALAATTRLRQWDRRVRVAATWLASFQADLRRPAQATPARWLQEYDAAHFASWHAYRAAHDFWGNGEASATGTTPYFAAAIGQCDAVLPQELRPIRYDLPGGKLVTFAEQNRAALDALRAWEPIDFPKTFNVSAGAGDAQRVDLAIQAGAAAQQLVLPPGTATLTLAPAAGATSAEPAASFAETSDQPTRPIPLPLKDGPPVAATAFLKPAAGDGQPGARPALEAKLWYRGHVKTRPLPLSKRDSQYIEYEVTQPRYDAPLVEVRGKDAPRGAFLFVFDCSRSMQGGNFAAAQSELVKALNQFQRDAGDSLSAGLMVYGSQTDASANYYTGDSRRGGQGGLTPLGQQQQAANPAFTTRHPHPDGDLTMPVPLRGGKTSAVLAALAAMREQQCTGVTPLYYATTKAIETALRDAADQPARRVIVISDGVNMPYNTTYDAGTQNYFLGDTGRRVNQEDYANLDRALAASKGLVQVTVQLFASIRTNFDREQYRILKQLDQRHDNFEVLETSGTLLFESIMNSLPKASIELTAGKSGSGPQALAFNQPDRVKDWDNPGVLRRELERRAVRLKVPGEDRTLEKPLDLLGGEQVVLAYDGAQAQLSFIDDGLTPRRSVAMDGPRGSDAFKLQFDALDPERVGNAIRKFRFRLRDEDRSARLAPRPRYVWIEMRPRNAAADAGDLVYPCLDAVWLDSVNLPRLEAPVERWPDAATARVQAWLRYSEPLVSPTALVSRDSTGETVTIDREKWQIMHVPAEENAPRRIVVRYAPSEPAAGVGKLQERAVWLHPPPQHIRRSYALDGSEAIHEFTYTDADSQRAQVQVRIVSRGQFQQGAYAAELEFDTN